MLPQRTIFLKREIPFNWGMWRLPQMTIGYKANQYDCDGKIATAIILDEPIEIDGELLHKFQFGALRGHLSKYYKIY